MENKIKIGICDDDKDMVDVIRKLLLAQPDSGSYEISCFTDGLEMQGYIGDNRLDLAMLDIDMPGMDGFMLAKGIHMISVDTEVVFITAFNHLLYHCMDFRPLWFVRKSCLKEGLLDAMEKYRDKTGQGGVYLAFDTKLGKRTIPADDLLYIESMDHDLAVHHKEGIFALRRGKNMAYYEKEFAQYGFVRIHRSFLVNMGYVAVMEKGSAVMADGKRLPISRPNWDRTLDLYLKARKERLSV